VLLYIARQHAIHLERDIDLLILSVSLSATGIGIVSTRTHISSCFWHSGRGIILVFWTLPPLQNSNTLNTWK